MTPPAPRVFTTAEAKRKRAEATRKYWDSPAGKARAEAFGKKMLARRSAKAVASGKPPLKKGAGHAHEARIGLDDYGSSPETKPTGSADEPRRETGGTAENAPVSKGEGPLPTISIGSALPPPDLTSQYMAPPSSVAGLIKPAGPTEKEPLWQPRPATAEESNALVNAFVALELKGFDGLAVWADWDGWHHDPSEMEPDRVIWRYVLKRMKFDPGLLLVALAAIEILEREGTRYGQMAKDKKARAPAPTGRGAGKNPQEVASNDLRVVAPA